MSGLRFLINKSPPKFNPFFFKPINHFYLSTVFCFLSNPNRKNLHSATAKPLINTSKNNISYVQILDIGMDTQDTCPSVLLFFDKQRYIFNVGEGFQRYCTEHKIKLSKIDHIFLSRVCSETAGGLPDLLLTMAGIVAETMCVNMWGPSDLNYLVDAMRAFVPRAALVHTKSFGPTLQLDGLTALDSKKFSGPFDLLNDEVVKISAILLHPKENNGPASHSGELGPPLKPGDISVIYVCELPETQGKFHPEKANALGLRAGPKYRDLQKNLSVKSDDQDIMVNPRDVMDPPSPGPIVLLVDCPTTLHLQSLLSADSLNVYYTNFSGSMSETAKAVNCVIHLSPSSVSNSPDYQKWMKRFGHVQHIMAGREKKNVEIPVLKSSASRMAVRLNYLCPQFFPASGFWPFHIEDNSLLSKSSTEEPQATISAESLLKFNLRPHAKLGLDRSSIPLATGPAEIVGELRAKIPEIVDAVQQVKQLWDHPREAQNDLSSQDIMEEPWLDELGLPSCLENITREDMEIVLLGTGSSRPSRYRNVASIFINLFSKGSLLFDCGEGTLGQLKRRFGVEGADDAVRSLRCIWISHIHADHHTGLARILALRRDLLKDVPHEPLLVVGPGLLMMFLNAYHRLEELDMQFLDCKFTTRASWDSFEKSNSISDEPSSSNSESPVDSTLFTKGNPMQSYWQKPGSTVGNVVNLQKLSRLKNILQEAGLENLISFPVVHCPQAYGVSLKAAQRSNNIGEMIPGWKIVYSGDTRPCPQLIEESRGATVLIHEATFDDDMVDKAVAKNHSTTQEAIKVGEAAGVYRLILTHFSQRYPKIPVFGDAHMHNTCIGFDMMSINLADLPLLPQVLPHLKLLFQNEMGVDEVEDLPLES